MSVGKIREYRGGGQVGRVWSSYPFVTLRIDEDRIELSSPVSTHVVARERLHRIVIKRPWLRFLASQLRFEHDQAGLAQRVEFWTFRPNEVISGLQAMGYGDLL